jgi:hypothetical protein
MVDGNNDLFGVYAKLVRHLLDRVDRSAIQTGLTDFAQAIVTYVDAVRLEY